MTLDRDALKREVEAAAREFNAAMRGTDTPMKVTLTYNKGSDKDVADRIGEKTSKDLGPFVQKLMKDLEK